MRKLLSAPLLICCALVMISCKKDTASNGPHATVYLRDGTSYAGVVTASSPQAVTMAGDDHQTRTFTMADLQSVQYDAPAAPATPVNAQAPAPAQAPADIAHQPEYHPAESAVQTRTYEVPAGTEISVRTEETIDSSRAVEGQTYDAVVTRDILDPARAVVVPRGANAHILIRSAAGGGHFRGRADLVMDLGSVSIDGRRYNLATTDVVERGNPNVGKNKKTGEFVGGGALVGTIIGAIAGGGKGAAIGAASGAGAGFGSQLVTHGSSIRIPVETVLRFRLERPLRVTAAQ